MPAKAFAQPASLSSAASGITDAAWQAVTRRKQEIFFAAL
jgi:hypothetical protein